MKIGIITDSTASLELVNYTHPHIKIIDFSLSLDGVPYKISEIDPNKFYKMMSEAKELPRTSQGTVSDVQDIFSKFESEGYTDVLVMTLSAQLSGSFGNVVTASREFDSMNIHLIDSKTTAFVLGDAVIETAKLIDSGKNVEQIKFELSTMYDNDGVFFYVDSLKYLVKGGRISGAAGMIGEVFKIKPVLEITNKGTIELVNKNRTKKKTLNMLLKMYHDKTDGRKHKLFAFFTDNEEEVNEFIDDIRSNENVVDTYVTGLTPAVSAHAGGGVIGIGWRFV